MLKDPGSAPQQTDKPTGSGWPKKTVTIEVRGCDAFACTKPVAWRYCRICGREFCEQHQQNTRFFPCSSIEWHGPDKPNKPEPRGLSLCLECQTSPIAIALIGAYEEAREAIYRAGTLYQALPPDPMDVARTQPQSADQQSEKSSNQKGNDNA